MLVLDDKATSGRSIGQRGMRDPEQDIKTGFCLLSNLSSFSMAVSHSRDPHTRDLSEAYNVGCQTVAPITLHTTMYRTLHCSPGIRHLQYLT
jgi:hypothetical protein